MTFDIRILVMEDSLSGYRHEYLMIEIGNLLCDIECCYGVEVESGEQ